MKAKKRQVQKGAWSVEVDGKTHYVEGKKVTRRDGSEVFKAKGVGKNNPIKKVKDKTIKGSTGLVKRSTKKTVYKK